MAKMTNPAARAGANRVLNIKALTGVDVWNPTETHQEFQSQSLAIAAVMRRAPVSIHYARVIVELYGMGGVA